MGFFSGKSKTYVSSVVYNMAGDELERPDYLKTTVVGAVLSPQTNSVAESISWSYRNGPGLRLRSFSKWAKTSGYTADIGQVAGTLIAGNSIDEGVIATYIDPEGQTVIMDSAKIGSADYTYWVDEYMLENHPTLVNSAYTASFDETTLQAEVVFEDLTRENFSIPGFNKYAKYLYVTYLLGSGEQTGALVLGSTVVLADGQPFPSTSGFTLISNDGTEAKYQRYDYIGDKKSKREFYTQWIVVSGSTTTRSYRKDEQITSHNEVSDVKVFIYKQGDGIADLDAMFNSDESVGQFLPYIPIRIDNRSINEFPAEFARASKAYKKSVNSKFQKIVDNIEDNPNIGDIDFAYIVFGVSLNVVEAACKKYVYNFFKAIMEDPGLNSATDYALWRTQWNNVQDSKDAWAAWSLAQGDPFDPLYNTAEPVILSYPPMPGNSIQIQSNGAMNYNVMISWNYISEFEGTGLGKLGAKKGDIWFAMGDTDIYQEQTIYGAGDGIDGPAQGFIFTNREEVEHITLTWQTSNTEYKLLNIAGLKHRNMVYNGHSVDTTAKFAINDAEESGFIIPLHEDVFREMSLIDQTQMATACVFVQFNCYQVVKQKWYQTGLFKIILIIVIIIISIFYPPAGAAAGGGGLLGGNVAVGTAVGFSGATALIVGAAINAIAAMVLSTIISKVATSLFGAKIGAIVAAVVTIVAMAWQTVSAGGQSLAQGFEKLLRAENLLKLTSALSKGYASFVQAEVAEIQADTIEIQQQYNLDSKAITDQYLKEFGSNGGVVNPMMLTDAIGNFNHAIEPINSFLGRTLMTGHDVAEMSFSMINDFAKIMTSTELP